MTPIVPTPTPTPGETPLDVAAENQAAVTSNSANTAESQAIGTAEEIAATVLPIAAGAVAIAEPELAPVLAVAVPIAETELEAQPSEQAASTNPISSLLAGTAATLVKSKLPLILALLLGIWSFGHAEMLPVMPISNGGISVMAESGLDRAWGFIVTIAPYVVTILSGLIVLGKAIQPAAAARSPVLGHLLMVGDGFADSLYALLTSKAGLAEDVANDTKSAALASLLTALHSAPTGADMVKQALAHIPSADADAIKAIVPTLPVLLQAYVGNAPVAAPAPVIVESVAPKA
jgi:hypothetical protein